MTILIRGKFRDGDTQGEAHVKTEAETGLMYLQANECQRSPTATGSWEEVPNRFTLRNFWKEPTLLTF